MALLEVTGLEKWYGKRKVVDGVAYEVNAGEVVGLLGPNGAGKTTSFRMTTGQITPNGGTVVFNGEVVTTLPMYRRARLGMGYLSQEPSIFRKLTVEQNLLAILESLPRSRSLGRRLTRAERRERVEESLDRFNLTHVRHNPAARCSGGEKRRLEIARCLVCEPLLILLDEPFAAVDPKTKEDIRLNIRQLADTGIGILVTDHDVREVLKITDRSYLIQAGQVVTRGTPSELIRDPIAIKEYLGNTFVDDGLMARFPTHGPARSEPITLTPAPPPMRSLADVQLPPAPPVLAFSAPAQQLLEQEKVRRLIDQLRDPDKARVQVAVQELSARGASAVPLLLETLERRELELRHLAFRLLESITGEKLTFQSDAPEDVRLRQVAYLRARLERKAG